jgi:hypothetical protein
MTILSHRITNGPTVKSGRRPPLLIGLVLIAVAGGSLMASLYCRPDFHRARAKSRHDESGRHREGVCVDGFGRPHCRGSGPHPRWHRNGTSFSPLAPSTSASCCARGGKEAWFCRRPPQFRAARCRLSASPTSHPPQITSPRDNSCAPSAKTGLPCLVSR